MKVLSRASRKREKPPGMNHEKILRQLLEEQKAPKRLKKEDLSQIVVFSRL